MTDNFDSLRSRMVVGQMVARGIKDKNILRACQKVERHLFVPKDLENKAYEDLDLNISANQTIYKPYMVAFMLEAANLDNDSRVLEVGTGYGYQSAILAEICREVFTIEVSEELASISFPHLESIYRNIHTKLSDGLDGWEDVIPFDAIIVTAATKKKPQKLIDQICIGGRIIFPLEDEYGDMVLLKAIKQESGKCEFEELMDASFDTMIGKIIEEV